MAVDAHHLLLSPPQLFSNIELMMMNNNNNTIMEPTNGGFCNNIQTGYGVVSPSLLHMYGNAVDTIPTIADSFTNYYADAANLPLPTRKRSRDSIYHQHHLLKNSISSSSCCVNSATTSTFPFLGQDIDHISSHINQHHYEIDRFISLHMERLKFEIEEKRKRQARTTMEAIIEEHGVLVKKLRVKEEEREKIGKINHSLEEHVKSLSMENQIWRDLAQTNEATAHHLRTNLEQVLAQVKDPGAGLHNVYEDHAESCSGAVDMEAQVRMCRNCGEEESCVLLLPCRHLCLCGVCGTNVHTCPICRSPKIASIHVNMAS